jgi:CRP-like cAMP-binding protein
MLTCHHIKKSLLILGDFSETELNTIISRLKPLQLKKGYRIISEGQFCKDFYFIESGACRRYTITGDGSETTLNLYIEGDWLFDYKSFVNQQPAEGIIETTEDSEILVLSGIDFHELIKTSDAFFQLGKIFQAAIQNQDYQRKQMKPEEKYVRLLSTRPQLIQRFPLKWIASYLDITAETISRVRRKLVS